MMDDQIAKLLKLQDVYNMNGIRLVVCINKNEKNSGNGNNNNNNNNTIKNLHLSWYHSENRYGNNSSSNNNNYIYDRYNPPVELEALWKLKDIQKLFLNYFPHVSTTATEPNQNNNDNNNNNINNNNDTTTTTTMTTFTPPPPPPTTTTTTIDITTTIGHLSQTLQELSFIRCPYDGFCIPPDIGMLIHLTHLSIGHCYLEELPPEIGNLSNLQQFKLEMIYRLRYLPMEIGHLTNLQQFYLIGCMFLMELPTSIGNLSTNLQTLEIVDCDDLKHLPMELNNLCTTLKTFSICGNESLQQSSQQPTTTTPHHFNFDISKFQTLQSLKLGSSEFGLRHDVEMVLLRTLPSSLEILILNEIDGCGPDFLYLVSLLSPPLSTSSSSLSTWLPSLPPPPPPPLSLLLPRGIRKLYIDDCYNSIRETQQNQHFVRSLIQTYKKLGTIDITSNPTTNMDLLVPLLEGKDNDGEGEGKEKDEEVNAESQHSLGLFTKELLHFMFLNRCGRILFNSSNDYNDNDNVQSSNATATTTTTATTTSSSMTTTTNETTNETATIPICHTIHNKNRPLPLSMWPVVLEQVKGRIGTMKNEQSEQLMTASVIFSLLQGPALMEHLSAHCFSSSSSS